MIIRRFFLWISMAVTAFAVSEPDDGVSEAALIVGTTSGYAPYVSLNEEGQYVGFDIDFSYLLAEKLKRKLIIKDFGSMPGLMLALKQGKADFIIWAISITKDRMEKLEMVYYQGEIKETTPFLFWEKIPGGIASISDLENIPGNIVCVEAGSSQEEIVKAFPKLNVKYVDKVLDIVMDLKYKKCLTTTIDSGLIAGYQKKYPQLKVLELPIPPQHKLMGNGIAINKKNQKLAQQVRSATKELQEEGKIAELEKKWNLQ